MKFTEINKSEFIKQFNENTLEGLAEKYNCSIPTVRRLANLAGLKKKKPLYNGNLKFILVDK